MPSILSRATVADGTELLVRHWPADEVEAGGAWAGDPWASILIVHGLGEQSGRYEHVGDQFAAAGTYRARKFTRSSRSPPSVTCWH